MKDSKIEKDKIVTLYHGSKSGIHGEIYPGITLANEICRKYRREGRFFDEILEEDE